MTEHQMPSALRLDFEPGTYQCAWFIEQDSSEPVRAPGEVQLLADYPPSGQAFENVPTRWTEEPDGSQTLVVPQTTTYRVLRGQLVSGVRIALVDCTLSVMVPGRASINAKAALVGRGAWEIGENGATSTVFQLTHTGRFFGTMPIKSFEFPGADGELSFTGKLSIETNPEMDLEWTEGSTELRCGHIMRTNLGNPFSFYLATSPVISVSVETPLAPDEWIKQWVQPARSIVALATKQRSSITFLALSTSGKSAQVFGHGLLQDPFSGHEQEIRQAKVLFSLREDAVSMLAMISSWLNLRAMTHPLIEIFGSSLLMSDEHPRATFLNLIQSLEGLHSFDINYDQQARLANYKSERAQALRLVKLAMGSRIHKFLRRNLPGRPSDSLASRLKFLLNTLPIDMRDKLDGCKLVRDELDADKNRTTEDAVARIRNDLSHGNRAFAPEDLAQLTLVLDAICRAHMLRLLGLSETVVSRALDYDGSNQPTV